jgi:hypothetical protein
MKLSHLSVLLGIGLIAPGILGLAKPAQLAALARQFPRNFAAGVALMLLGTAWFVWNVNGEPIADFSVFKPYMMIGFTAVGVLSCIFVRDFLAVRGLAVVMLLLAKLMLDTGRPHLGESPFVPLFQGWAYVFVVLGIWFTITPWRLRDILEWATANEARLRLLSGLRLAFAVFIVILGLTAFHAM